MTEAPSPLFPPSLDSAALMALLNAQQQQATAVRLAGLMAAVGARTPWS